MSFTDFIRPELLVLVPVMYLVGVAVKKSPLRDYIIPYLIGGVSVLLSTLYVLATTALSGWQDGLLAVFTAVTQGVLTAGASVYINQLVKQGKNGATAEAFAKSFTPPAAEPLLITDLVKSGNKVRPGTKHGKNKIIIHDTGNSSKTADALSHAKYLHMMAGLNSTYISWGYTVDADRIVQHIPDDEIAYHAGDGTAPDSGNMSGIGIEMCICDMSRFGEVLQNTAWLAARLMHKYGWPISCLRQHFDCSGKDCPHEVRRVPGGWEAFLRLCEAELRKLDEGTKTEAFYRVQAGAWKSRELAQDYAAKLKSLKVDGQPIQALVRFY